MSTIKTTLKDIAIKNHAAGRETADRQATDQRATDQRATDQRATDQRATDQRATDQQAVDWPHWQLGGTVWVLEDEALEREPIVRALRQSGFHVREFDTVRGFSLSLESEPTPAAVVADIRLEDGNFFDIFDNYSPLKIPTIILSYTVTPTHIALVEERGGGYISILEKPAKPIVLSARIVSMARRAYIDKGRAEMMTLDAKNHTAYNRCGRVSVTKLHMNILGAIDAALDFRVTIDDLIRLAWPDERAISPQRVRVNISRLNDVIGDIGLRIDFNRTDRTYSLSVVSEDTSTEDPVAETSQAS